MEISDYLRMIRRRLWILIVVPVLAGLVGLLAFAGAPRTYSSSVEVAAPTTAENTTTGAVAVFVSSFTELLTTQPVVDRVSRETGASRARLRSGLAAGAVGGSSLIKVTYTSTRRQEVQPAVEAATRATLDLVSGPQVAAATSALKVAQDRYQAARDAVDRYASGSGGGLPDDQYRQKLANLSALRLAATSARLDLAIPKANGLDAQIPIAEREIAELLPKVVRFNQLQDTLRQASDALSNALIHEQDTKGQLNAHESTTTLKNATPQAQSRASSLLRSVGVLAGVGLIAACLLVAFLELTEASRARRRARPEGSRAAQAEVRGKALVDAD